MSGTLHSLRVLLLQINDKQTIFGIFPQIKKKLMVNFLVPQSNLRNLTKVRVQNNKKKSMNFLYHVLVGGLVRGHFSYFSTVFFLNAQNGLIRPVMQRKICHFFDHPPFSPRLTNVILFFLYFATFPKIFQGDPDILHLEIDGRDLSNLN